MRTTTFFFVPLLALAGLLSGSGCNPSASSSSEQLSRADEDALARVRSLEEEVERLRLENQEVQRLRKDNQEVHRLRGQYQELLRLREENEQLRKQLIGVRGPGRSSGSTAPARPSNPRSSAGTETLPLPPSPLPFEPEVELPPEFAREEADRIAIETRFLPLLFPEYDWSTLERTEPLVINELLEAHGVVLTNYQQLLQWGVTNYQVERIELEP